jgi:hypothetical protein
MEDLRQVLAQVYFEKARVDEHNPNLRYDRIPGCTEECLDLQVLIL